jgi:hypothetical protein
VDIPTDLCFEDIYGLLSVTTTVVATAGMIAGTGATGTGAAVGGARVG